MHIYIYIYICVYIQILVQFSCVMPVMPRQVLSRQHLRMLAFEGFDVYSELNKKKKEDKKKTKKQKEHQKTKVQFRAYIEAQNRLMRLLKKNKVVH